MNKDRDPFDLMPRFVDPEPDPVIMHATIAQSREAFEQRKGVRGSRPASFAQWLGRSARWLVPAGATAVALAVVIVAAPSLMVDPMDPMADRQLAQRPSPMPSSSTSLSRGDGEVVDLSAANEPVRRMGVTVPPAAEQAPLEALPQVVSSFQGDGVRLGLRLDAEALEIYLPDLSGEPTIDAQSVMPGETVEILSAFLQPGSELIAIQIQVDDVRFWRVYQQVDGSYQRDPERSTLVSNAADRAEVERRLAAN